MTTRLCASHGKAPSLRMSGFAPRSAAAGVHAYMAGQAWGVQATGLPCNGAHLFSLILVFTQVS